MSEDTNFTVLRNRHGLRLYLSNRYSFITETGIMEPKKFVQENSSSIIDYISNTKISSIILKTPQGDKRIIAKEYLPRKGFKSIKDIFRNSKPVREFLTSLKLSELSIACPEPVAAAEIRKFRKISYCALFAEEMENSSSLHNLIKNSELSKLPEKRLITLSKSLASSIAYNHNKGFLHKDLNASHILISSFDKNTPSFHYIDFENSRLYKSALSVKLRARDLIRLYKSVRSFVSERVMLRFLITYGRKSNTSPKLLLNQLQLLIANKLNNRKKALKKR
ncbi:MAG: lipopolysaccharide kinase InaA family protein [Planctomycetota bacterium]